MTAAQVAWDTSRHSGKLTPSEASALQDRIEATEQAWRDCVEKAEAAPVRDHHPISENPN